MEMLVLDQTRPDIGLRVAKVIVPGMRHMWKRLGTGRLYDVPVSMGWLKEALTEDELNPFPMWMYVSSKKVAASCCVHLFSWIKDRKVNIKSALIFKLVASSLLNPKSSKMLSLPKVISIGLDCVMVIPPVIVV